MRKNIFENFVYFFVCIPIFTQNQNGNKVSFLSYISICIQIKELKLSNLFLRMKTKYLFTFFVSTAQDACSQVQHMQHRDRRGCWRCNEKWELGIQRNVAAQHTAPSWMLPPLLPSQTGWDKRHKKTSVATSSYWGHKTVHVALPY